MSKSACMWLGLGLALASVGAAAQTTVTNSNNGVSGAVPVYSGTATLGPGSSSPISVSGSNVGIGATNPQASLQIGTYGPYLYPGGGGLATDYASSGIGFNLYYGSDGYWHTTSDGANGGGYTLFGNTAGSLYLLDVLSAGNVSQVLSDATVFPSKVAFSVVNGYVGIGTPTPTYPLSLVGANNPEQFQIQSTSSGGHNWSIASFATYSGFNTGGLGFGDYTAGSWRLYLDGSGNVGIGTTSPGAKLEVSGSIKLSSGSGGAITFQDGTTQSTAYTGTCPGGDYAESVDVAGDRTKYEPGDVLVIGADSGSDVAKSSEPYSTLVVGVYSTKPGVVGRRQTTDQKTSKTEVPMAMVGIVPTKVSAENGPIKRGDLLVTSSTSGYAMKGTDRSLLTGAVIGKALGSLDSGTGVIEVVVTLQ